MQNERYAIAQQPASLFAEMQNHVCSLGVTPAMALAVLCTVISILTQGVADVLWPNGRRARVGISSVVVGHSGSGKSLIYSLLMEAIEHYIAAAATQKDAAGESRGWDFLLEDTTPAAIPALVKRLRFAALATDEAGSLGLLQRAAATIAKLIDGTALRRTRATTDPISLVGHRFVVLLLQQPHVLQESRLLAMDAGGVGLLNRCLTAIATPIVGSLHQVTLPPVLAGLHEQRVRELLDAARLNVLNNRLQLPTLEMSNEAKACFITRSDEAREESRRATGARSGLAEYMSRHGERTLQLAGAIHMYTNGLSGLFRLISAATIETAHWIGVDSIAAYAQLSHRPTRAEADAALLLQALRHYHATSGLHFIVMGQLYRNAPNIGLTRQRLKAALPSVIGAGHAWIATGGREDVLQFRFSSPFLTGRYA